MSPFGHLQPASMAAANEEGNGSTTCADSGVL
jgi:hypothetical protein